jgi:hypothetical protein
MGGIGRQRTDGQEKIRGARKKLVDGTEVETALLR